MTPRGPVRPRGDATLIYGLTVLDEPASPLRLLFLATVGVGIVGLHQTGG